MNQKNRPTSPHLSIYKLQLTSMFSIMHRMSGLFLYIFLICACIFITSKIIKFNLPSFAEQVIGANEGKGAFVEEDYVVGGLDYNENIQNSVKIVDAGYAVETIRSNKSPCHECLIMTILKYLLLGAFTVAVVYHFCNGVRHLFWDINVGLNVKSVEQTAIIVGILTITFSALVWIIVFPSL